MTMCVLGVLAIPPSIILQSRVNHIVFASSVAQLVAYLFARRNQTLTSILLALGCTALEHVVVVGMLKELGPVPYLAPIMVLITAATLTSAWLPHALVLSLATIAAEAYLSAWSKTDQGATLVSVLLTLLIFVVSLMHVQGTERALKLAEQMFHERIEAHREADHMRERLVRSERMEALGRLAGGVAHDFNNLLTVITGAVEMVQARTKDDENIQDLDMVLSATDSASRLTNQLLTFSKRELIPTSDLDLGATLERRRSVYEGLVGPQIQLSFDFEPNLPKVDIPESHVEQLAMNLAVNARDAMGGNGPLRFSLKRRTIEENEVTDLEPGEYVEFSVSDSGRGIDPAIRNHLFDPFFTTKGDAGTGLGLATCYGIVKRLAGAILVESELGKGATFRVLLPAVDGPQTPRAETTRSLPPVRSILVVDDEANILSLTRRQLEAAGYSVIVAATARAARKFIEDPLVPLDALLTDIVVGDERGTDLLDSFQQHRPGKRIVVMSGFAPDPNVVDTLLRVQAHFLPKPFTRQTLLRALETNVVLPWQHGSAGEDLLH